MLLLDSDGSVANGKQLCEWLMSIICAEEADLRYVVNAIVMSVHGRNLCEAVIKSDISSLSPSIILQELVMSSSQSLLTITLRQELNVSGTTSHFAEVGRKICRVITCDQSILQLSDSLLDLITISLQCQTNNPSLLMESLFELLAVCSPSNRSHLLSHLSSLITLIVPLNNLLLIHSPTELIQVIETSPACEYLIRFIFLYLDSYKQIVISQYLPQINSIPVEMSESDFVHWVDEHPFFALMNRKEVLSTFEE